MSIPTTTSLQHLKSLLPSKKVIFCYFISNSDEQTTAISYQSTSNIIPWLPLHTSQPTPEEYNTTAQLTLPYKYT